MQVQRIRLAAWLVSSIVFATVLGRPAANEGGGGHSSGPAPTAATDGTIEPNDNRRPAGAMSDGVVRIRLRAGRGQWRPERTDGPTIDVAAFGEEGGALQIPGPLVRVAAGTEIVITVRNSLTERLDVHGFQARPAEKDAILSVAPNETREIRFSAGAPGTYHYWAATASGAVVARRRALDSQLGGAFIVDPKGGPTADGVFVMTQWDDSPVRSDTIVNANTRVVFAINGLSWPHTERLDERVGRDVRWHLINLTQTIHPMHLHGFHFVAQGVGVTSGLRYTAYAPDQLHEVVTHGLLQGATVQIRWMPARPGNWLLHCHFLSHVTPALRFWTAGAPAGGHDAHDVQHAGTAMAGLVMGIRVTGDEPAPASASTTAPRQITLVMHQQPGYWRPEDAYGFSLKTGPRDPEPRDLTVPGPLLVLTRGEPVQITLENKLPVATAIHWHGIELDSYYDGVPGWSGTPTTTTPSIRSRESFVVRFTPPRAGTFIYHTHSHDDRQLASGLYGALVVVEPGETFDPDRDHVVLLGMQGPKNTEVLHQLPVVVNGRRDAALTLKAGVANRLRFINITTSFSGLMATMVAANNPLPPLRVEWLPVAKDGADLPPSLRTARPADQNLGVGQTHDFLFTPSPTGPTTLWIDIRRIDGEWVQQVPVRVVR